MHCIAVNNSWQLATWADVLYSCDMAWWKLVKGAPEFTKLKISYDGSVRQHFPGVTKIDIPHPAENRLLVEHPGQIAPGATAASRLSTLRCNLVQSASC